MTAMGAEAPTNAEPAPAELASPSVPSQGLTVLVCGDRHWSDGLLILRTLQSLGTEVPKRPPAEPVPQSSGLFPGEAGSSVRTLQAIPGVSRVIHGGCRGADLLGGWAARRLGIPVDAFPADWAGEGRAAGPLRNARMLAQGRPGLVLAFHDRLSESRGTRDMLVRAGEARVAIRVVSHARPEGTGSLADLGGSRGAAASRDARRTRSEAHSAFRAPLVGGEDGMDDRRYTVLDTTSGLPDDSRDEDQHARAVIEHQRQGRVAAAQEALKARPEARELVMRDQTKQRLFCARFGITAQDLCPHAETDDARVVHPGSPRDGMCGWCSGRHGWQPIHVADVEEALRSPCDWRSEMEARASAVLPGSEAWGVGAPLARPSEPRDAERAWPSG